MPRTYPAEPALFRERGYLPGFRSAMTLEPLRRSIQVKRLIEGKGGTSLRRPPVFRQTGSCSAAVRVSQLQSTLSSLILSACRSSNTAALPDPSPRLCPVRPA